MEQSPPEPETGIIETSDRGPAHSADGNADASDAVKMDAVEAEGIQVESKETPAASPDHVRHFLVRGRVQGVGFRWFVHREAAELGLRGWVRNLVSGEVELVAAGDPEAVADLRESLRRGSRGSRVDAVIEHPLTEAEAAELKEFKIEGAW